MKGRKVTARQRPDGKWNVLDIPCFAEHEAQYEDDAGDIIDVHVDEDYMRALVDLNRARYELDGYEAPAHVNHIFGPTQHSHPSADGGVLLLRDVKPMRFEGRVQPVMFLDLRELLPEVYQRIKAKELRYVSIEIDFPDREVASCSIMSHIPPHFRFGPIIIGKEVPWDGKPRRAGYSALTPSPDRPSVRKTGVITYARATPGGEAKTMDEPKKKADGQQPIELEEDLDLDMELDEDDGLEEFMREMMEEDTELLEDGDGGELDPDDETSYMAAVEDPDAEPETMGGDMPSNDKKKRGGQYGQMQKRLASQQAEIDKMKRDKRRASLVRKAIRQLVPLGYSRRVVVKRAQECFKVPGGEKQFTSYCRGLVDANRLGVQREPGLPGPDFTDAMDENATEPHSGLKLPRGLTGDARKGLLGYAAEHTLLKKRGAPQKSSVAVYAARQAARKKLISVDQAQEIIKLNQEQNG